MRTDAATERMKEELHSLLDTMRADLDRIDILLAALNGFSSPVPDYEPGFQHLQHFKLNAHELGQSAGRR